MALRRVSLSSFLFLCFHLLAPLLYTTSDAALSSYILQAINCSTSGNYTGTDTYAANVNQFLASLPQNAVSKNGGFFNGTVGLGPDTVYGLAMCPADYSRADCGDCLAGAAASSTDGLPNRCPGSTTVLAMFDRCLIRYSNVNFFGAPEIGIVQALSGQPVFTSTPGLYSPTVIQSFKDRTAEAMVSPQRFSASSGDPYTFVQCTWDLPADKCKQCLDVLWANASSVTAIRMDGQRKSYSCTVRYSNTSFMVVPFTAVSGPTPQSADQTSTLSPPSSSSASRAATVVGAVIAVLVVICLAALIWYVHILKLRNKRREFTYKQLADATHNFADKEKLGEGAFGAVYKGELEMGGQRRDVAVKRIIKITERTRNDFANEISVMSMVNHRNIIHLVGSCDESNNLLLVYELMNYGNLEEKLYPRDATIDAQVYRATDPGTALHLNWHTRKNILIGIASGLAYLHSECGSCVLHRDIKPSNVMLDRSFNAKLCDFGLVSQVRHTQSSRLMETVCGTRPYMDPQYAHNGMLSEQSDVYSFGVVLLEVVCGVRPSLQDGTKNTLVERVRECHGRNAILEAADRQLRGPQSDQGVKRVLMIGLLCVQPEPQQRPHIIEVKEYLRSTRIALPSLAGNGTEYATCTDAPLTQTDEESGEAALL